MITRYDVSRENFYISARDFVAGVCGKVVQAKILPGLKFLSEHPTWFSENGKDFRMYYAYLDAYHAISDYYNFRAQYDKPDAKLDTALANWYKLVQSKQNIFARVAELVKKR